MVDHAASPYRSGSLKTALRMARPTTTGALDATFVALSDATRRDMIRTLLQKPRRAGEQDVHGTSAARAEARIMSGNTARVSIAVFGEINIRIDRTIRHCCQDRFPESCLG